MSLLPAIVLGCVVGALVLLALQWILARLNHRPEQPPFDTTQQYLADLELLESSLDRVVQLRDFSRRTAA